MLLITILAFAPSSLPQNTGSPLGLCQGKLPRAVKDFGTWTIKAHRVVPPRRDRQAILDLAVAAAELDGDGTVLAFLPRDIVNGIGVILVGLDVAIASCFVLLSSSVYPLERQSFPRAIQCSAGDNDAGTALRQGEAGGTCDARHGTLEHYSDPTARATSGLGHLRANRTRKRD